MTFSCVSTRFKDLKADASPFSTTIVRARNLWCAILKSRHTERLRMDLCAYNMNVLLTTFSLGAELSW